MGGSDLSWLSAAELGALYRRRELTPVEVVHHVFQRMEETEPALNAFVHRDEPGALAAAEAAEERFRAGDGGPPMLGIPVSVKDLIDVAGMPCRYGSLALSYNVPAEDSPSVGRLRAAGAVIVGKTTTSEFGLRGFTESRVHGLTRNPWDLARTPGGSSGGAAASVAAGVTPVALGTDGGGSIRTPSALTGLVGIKAQFGRIAVFPPSATPTIAHVGPMARTAVDAALLLAAAAGPDLRDWTSLLPSLSTFEGDLRKLRVAFSPTLGFARVAPAVAASVSAAVEKLAGRFAAIETVDTVCPDAAWIMAGEFVAGVDARVRELGAPLDILDPPTARAVEGFRARDGSWLSSLQRARFAHRETLRAFFERFDVLLTPTAPVSAWPVETAVPPGYEDAISWSYFTYPFNLSGQPAASVPCGLDDAGLPIGLQIVVSPQREALLTTLVAAAEETLGPIGRVPPLA
jgi:aspartyl-tRNA(Asn)/glutamyl-tRNA(Gln) amidotransferase subunit A